MVVTVHQAAHAAVQALAPLGAGVNLSSSDDSVTHTPPIQRMMFNGGAV